MEEDIKILEEFAFELEHLTINTEEIRKGKALYNLIERYKELEEENKTYIAQLNGAFDRGFIPISVIQNKIDELKEQFRDYDAKWTKALRDKRHPFYRYLIRIEAEIDILQELLEKGEK